MPRANEHIKKSRAIFADLVKDIDDAAKAQTLLRNTDKAKLDKAETTASEYRQQLDEAFVREVSLLRQVYELKKQLAALAGCTVRPIRQGEDASGKKWTKALILSIS